MRSTRRIVLITGIMGVAAVTLQAASIYMFQTEVPGPFPVVVQYGAVGLNFAFLWVFWMMIRMFTKTLTEINSSYAEGMKEISGALSNSMRVIEGLKVFIETSSKAKT